jgi:hypothetical protein
MKNQKVIVLSGYCYGGTNIVWNILQSHPQICSPMFETGQLFHRSKFLRLCHALPKGVLSRFWLRKMDAEFRRFKLANLTHRDNKYLAEGVPYEERQVEDAALCFKSVNYDINLTEEILKVYPDLYFVALTRNGYALGDGYLRRRYSASDFGRIYREIAEIMRGYAERLDRFKLVRFEDVLADPFRVAEDLYEFVEVSPASVDSLRLKVKKTIGADGDHSVPYGSEKRKYWFDRSAIGQLLDPGIDDAQKRRISEQAVLDFETEAHSALEFFGYEPARAHTR